MLRMKFIMINNNKYLKKYQQNSNNIKNIQVVKRKNKSMIY